MKSQLKKGLFPKNLRAENFKPRKKPTSIIPVTWKNWPEYHPLTHPRSK